MNGNLEAIAESLDIQNHLSKKIIQATLMATTLFY